MAEKILEVKDLVVQFHTGSETVAALQGVSFSVEKGKTLGLVGESGSGKSVLGLSIMRLVPQGRIVGGEILYRGKALLHLPQEEMRMLRRHKISMIFQEPMTSLNPVFPIGDQIDEVLRFQKTKLSRRDRKEKVIEFLHLVGIPSPRLRVHEYPHQMSGGMRQRVMIAMALACDPDILIADEPTTALDVTIQAQILELIKKLQEKLGMSIIFITHDLGVVTEICDDVAVMYCGKIVEAAGVHTLFSHPGHPYTKGLMDSVTSLDLLEGKKREYLPTIEGMVPSLSALPAGCHFQDRCHCATDHCRGRQGEPKLEAVAPGHFLSCFHPLV